LYVFWSRRALYLAHGETKLKANQAPVDDLFKKIQCLPMALAFVLSYTFFCSKLKTMYIPIITQKRPKLVYPGKDVLVFVYSGREQDVVSVT
jgi:hypothetical protein